MRIGVLIGDFNSVVDQAIDKKYNKTYKKGKYPRVNLMPESFYIFAEEFGLVDAWRTGNLKPNGF